MKFSFGLNMAEAVYICALCITLQAQQLHYNNCDVVILMHKKNNKRRCWHSYGTPGAGDDFLKMHSEVSELWEEYIYNYEGNNIVFCGYVNILCCMYV